MQHRKGETIPKSYSRNEARLMVTLFCSRAVGSQQHHRSFALSCVRQKRIVLVGWNGLSDVKHQVLVSSNSFFKTAGQQ